MHIFIHIYSRPSRGRHEEVFQPLDPTPQSAVEHLSRFIKAGCSGNRV